MRTLICVEAPKVINMSNSYWNKELIAIRRATKPNKYNIGDEVVLDEEYGWVHSSTEGDIYKGLIEDRIGVVRRIHEKMTFAGKLRYFYVVNFLSFHSDDIMVVLNEKAIKRFEETKEE
jgi:hypothetical protein